MYWSWKYLIEKQMEEQEKVKASWGLSDSSLDSLDSVNPLSSSSSSSSSSSLDEIKDILLDTNPYYLALTALVYTLHSLCEFLAIKNEV